MNCKLASLLFFCAAFFVAPSAASAALITVPSGLNVGDTYRLVFVTSGQRDASSSNIADYNSFVQDAADAVPELAILAADWTAIGSTASVDARDNTGTNPTLSPGAPIFDLSGHIVADNNADLWDGGIDWPIRLSENGFPFLPTTTEVWTGSINTGSAQTSILALGGSGPIFGRGTTDSDWIMAGTDSPTVLHHMYAVSSLLTVVPEPSSFLLLCLAGIGVLGVNGVQARRRPGKHGDHS